MKSFKGIHSFENRKAEAVNICKKYPDRIPIIVEKCETCTLSQIEKSKFLVPKDMPMSQFVFTIRKRINLKPDQSLFVLVNGRLVSSNVLMSKIQEDHIDEDGFIYMIYTSENTFG